MKHIKSKELKECPYCGSDYGYFQKVSFSGKSEYNTPFVVNSIVDNSQLHDGVRYKQNKTKYCIDCRNKL